MNEPHVPAFAAGYAGVFTGRYHVTQTPWNGPDFSRLCWIFPGQGSAAPWMFAPEFRAEPAFRARLAEADALAVARGLPAISDYIFGRPMDGVVLAMVRILALFTAEVAVADCLRARSRPPELATAFSFGEMSALTALGVIAFAPMFELVCRREECCPPPGTLGHMIAVSGTPAAIGAALGEVEFHVSNLATPEQTVISVRVADVALAQRALRRGRVAARVLKEVPQPYHTPWLADAAARMAAHLRQSPPDLQPLRIPFFSSVLRRIIPAGPVALETFIEIISRQLVETVDFVRQIQAVRAVGCCGYIEIGPGEVCSRFVEDILPEAERHVWPLQAFLPASAVKPQETVTFELTPARHRLLGGLTRAISRLTGYELTSIAVENRFQEDLGIDSIKKADILFTVVRETALPAGEDLNVSQIRTVADAVQFLERQNDALPAEPATPAPAAEFFRMNWAWRTAPTPLRDTKPSRPVHTIAWRDLIDGPGSAAARDFFARLTAFGGDLIVLDRGGATAEREPFEELVAAVQWFQEHVARFAGLRLNVALVTCDATPWPARSLSAFLKSLTKETPALVCRCLQFDLWPGDDQATRCAQIELDAEGPVDLRFESGERMTGELVRCALTEIAPPLAAPVVIAFGGARGITHALLRAFAPEWRGRLHVVGRTAADDTEIVTALAELRSDGSTVEYHALDAANADAVAALFAEVHAGAGRIDLVLNGAGIECSSLLAQKSADDIRRELAGKLEPARAIFSAARRWRPTRLIHFSSVAARFGNSGQTVYALASQAIDELSRDFSMSVPDCVVTSIHWPAWDGVGMTSAPGIRQALLRSGVSMLPASMAAGLFREELSAGQTPAAVIDYFAPRDTWGFGLGLRDLRSLAPLIGQRRGVAGFERVFDLGVDAFLRDHCLDGRAYLPAAFGVAMCHALANGSGRAGRLEDFQMHAPLVVGDTPVGLTLQGTSAADGRLRLLARTAIFQFSCVVAEDRVAAVAAPTAPNRAARIDPTSLYRPDAFFHGPVFQVLHEIWSDESGALAAEMDAMRLLPIVGLESWDQLVQAIDGCFQVLALEGLLKHRVMALPTSIGIARFFGVTPWLRLARFVTARTRLEEGSLVGDVFVTSADGAAILELTEIRMRVLRSDVVAAVRRIEVS